MFGQRRVDPSPGTHYRSERVSAVNGQYFFSTREGSLEGPYFTRVDAEREIAFYIRRMIQAKEIMRMREWLEHTLAKHTGQDLAKVNKDIDRDKILTASEALEYGLIDQVLTSRKG